MLWMVGLALRRLEIEEELRLGRHRHPLRRNKGRRRFKATLQAPQEEAQKALIPGYRRRQEGAQECKPANAPSQARGRGRRGEETSPWALAMTPAPATSCGGGGRRGPW